MLKFTAAACLQEGVVLITNDWHFYKINDGMIIEIWSITKAIEEFEIEELHCCTCSVPHLF